VATTTGTADNHFDLLTKIRDYLVGTVGWTQVGGTSSGPINDLAQFVSLRGPGLSGDDQILVTMQPFSTAANNAYSIRVRGHTAYTTPGTSQPGADSNWCYLLTLNSPMSYWIVANGRRFIVVVKNSSRYDAMYAGFILPEHLPSDWSYPLFIGASSYTGSQSQANDEHYHSNFWYPVATSALNTASGSSYLFTPMQAWAVIRDGYPGSSSVTNTDTGRMTIPWSRICLQNVRRQIDGDPWFRRGQIVAVNRDSAGSIDSQVPEGGVFYGSFDGVFYTPAFGATAEQESVVGGVTYKMFPNIGRTSDGQFAAIAME